MILPRLVPVLLLVAPAPCQKSIGRADQVLERMHATLHFDLRYQPGSRAGARVDEVAFRIERELEEITGQLKHPVEQRFTIYLYGDAAELAAITGVTGSAGFSSGTQMHLPYDNDQTRYHELVHLVAAVLPSTGDEPRNLFFAEGLANGMLRFVHGVHVHCVAAFALRQERLPRLDEMTTVANFYAWMARHQDLDAYDIAGSYFRYLLDAFDVEQVRRYYTGTPAEKALGRSLAELENGWHRVLEGVELRPEVETLMRKRRGETVRFEAFAMSPDGRLPEAVVGVHEDWRWLMGAELDRDEDRAWQREDETLRGRAETADWSLCRLGKVAYGDAALRATVTPAANTIGVQLQLGPKCQAMLTNAGVFLWRDGAGVVHADGSERIGGRESLDLLVVRKGKRVVVYVDGFEVLAGDVDDTVGIPAIGVAGGRAEFREVRVRRM